MNKAQTKLEIMESRVVTNIKQIKEIIVKVLGVEKNVEGDFVISVDIVKNAKDFVENDAPIEYEFAQYILVKK